MGQSNVLTPTSIDIAEIRWFLTQMEGRAIQLYAGGAGDEARDTLRAALDSIFDIAVNAPECPVGWHRCKDGGCSPGPCIGPDVLSDDSTTDDTRPSVQ